MIVATAGHVDHGKTTLVRALTGVDTDRTEEEKRRGMSIDIGFAYAPFGQDEPLGFVDVPGHERFIRNMLAGVAAIDLALLVIAADDGPMPQTLEHLAVLDLLGVDRCAVALTKIDRVSEARLTAAHEEVRSTLARFDRPDTPIFPLSVIEQRGVAPLVEYLRQTQAHHTRRQAEGCFRLAVDRSFVAPGAGLVVTGAVLAGRCHEGDALRAWSLGAPDGTEVRVRSIRCHGRPAVAAAAGQRCALNLAGLDLKRFPIERGDWITAAEALAPSARLDTRVRLVASTDKSLPDGARVQLHIGAAERPARVALIGERTLAPAAAGWAQLVLPQPVHAVSGDRFVIRDPSAHRVIGGGIVIEPIGATRGRARPQRLAHLQAMAADTHAAALRALLQIGEDGVDLAAFAASRGMTGDASRTLVIALGLHLFDPGGTPRVLEPSQWASARARLLQALQAWHAAQPESIGPDERELATAAQWPKSSPLYRALIRALLDERAVVRKGFRLQLPTHRPRLTAADETLLQRVTGLLAQHAMRPPIVGELAADLRKPLPDLLTFLQRASTMGLLVRVAKNRWFLPATIESLQTLAQSLCAASADGKFDAAMFRDASGLGRNLTIELLEFFDRSQVTRFDGTRRAMAASAQR